MIDNDSNGQSGLSGAVAAQTFDREIPRLKSELSKMGITDVKKVDEQIDAARKVYLEQAGNIVKESKDQVNSVIEDQIKTVRDSLNQQLSNLLSPYLIYLPYLIGLSFS